MWIALILAISWLATAILSFGFVLGYNNNEYPDLNNLDCFLFNLPICIIGGPIALLATYFVYGFHHFSMLPLSEKEQYESFKKRFPHLAHQIDYGTWREWRKMREREG